MPVVRARAGHATDLSATEYRQTFVAARRPRPSGRLHSGHGLTASAPILIGFSLEEVAHLIWQLSIKTITYIPNGVNGERFSTPTSEAVPGLTRRPGELVIGTLGPLHPKKNIARLLWGFAGTDKTLPGRLVIACDGVKRGALKQLAHRLSIKIMLSLRGMYFRNQCGSA
jgi:glycosyltransferase involved in cell wall biosynthesis